MKEDERQLLAALRSEHPGPYKSDGARIHVVRFADHAGRDLGIHPKRVHYLLLKWADRGWWDYGVSVRSGWFTPEGWEELK